MTFKYRVIATGSNPIAGTYNFDFEFNSNYDIDDDLQLDQDSITGKEEVQSRAWRELKRRGGEGLAYRMKPIEKVR